VNPHAILHRILRPLNTKFGTYRGLIRLLLAYAELYTGRLKPFTEIGFHRVKRVVFVCQGNICRSCFADYYARSKGLAATSFGLATAGDAPAFPKAITAAKKFNIDLTAHITTDIEDFKFLDGDLLLVMEIRQARSLQAVVRGKPVQLSLLGLWRDPPHPHIHDPHRLTDDYFDSCFHVIAAAVDGLAKRDVAKVR
jgi:protein-tyrosine phosphatase